MAAKEKMAVDEFFGNYHGAIAGRKETDRGVILEIRTVQEGFLSSLFPFLSSTKEFPWPLDPEKNIIHVDGKNEVRLRPTPDVPGLDYERTIWARMSGDEADKVEDLQEENDQLRKQVGKLKKKVRRLQEEEEERRKRNSTGGQQQVPCPNCGESYAPQQWSANDGRCLTDDCNHVMHRYKSDD